MPKKITKDFAVQYEEIQNRNDAMTAMIERLGTMVRKQAKQLKEMPVPPKTP